MCFCKCIIYYFKANKRKFNNPELFKFEEILNL